MERIKIADGSVPVGTMVWTWAYNTLVCKILVRPARWKGWVNLAYEDNPRAVYGVRADRVYKSPDKARRGHPRMAMLMDHSMYRAGVRQGKNSKETKRGTTRR